MQCRICADEEPNIRWNLVANDVTLQGRFPGALRDGRAPSPPKRLANVARATRLINQKDLLRVDCRALWSPKCVRVESKGGD